MIEQKFLQQIVATTSNKNNPDSLVEKIAESEDIDTYIYHLNGNSESDLLLNKLRANKKMDPKDKNYGLVAFAIINHIFNEDSKSAEETSKSAEETSIKKHKETLIEFLLLMNNERPHLIKDVLSSLKENTNHIPTYLLILNKAIKSINQSVTALRSTRNDTIIESIEAIRKNLDPIDHAYYDGKIYQLTQENTVLQELFDTLYKKVAEQKRQVAEEASQAAKLLQASIRHLKPRQAAEESRKAAELLQASIRRLKPRQAAEESRKAAELLQASIRHLKPRQVAEEARQAAKLLQASIRGLQLRKAAEESRKAQEKRKAAEQERKAAEQERKAAEQERIAAEQERIAAEQERKAAEEARKAQEKRKTEEKRKAKEEKRERKAKEAAERKKEEKEEQARKAAEAKKEQAEKSQAVGLLQANIRRLIVKEARKAMASQAETVEEKLESGSDKLYNKLSDYIDKNVSEDDQKTYKEYIDQLINQNTPFITHNGAHIDINFKKELLKQLLSFSPRKEIHHIISKELRSIQENLIDYLDCFCSRIEDLKLLSENIIKDKKLVEKLIEIASNADKGKVIINYFYDKRENITLTGNNFAEIFKIILKHPNFFKKDIDSKIDYLKFLADSIDKDISYNLIGLMENFVPETKRADIKNQIYLMLLLDKNGKFLTEDLFRQYKDFYTANKDNEKLKKDFLSAIEKSAIEESKKTAAQLYIVSELLKVLETSSESKESSLSTFMKAGESERLSLVFIDQLCNEILKTEDNDQELQKFISQLKTKRQSLELDYTGSKFEQVIQYFMTHNINNPGQLAPFFEKIKLLELTLVEAMHLSKNPQNINLNAMQEALKKDPETLMHYGMSNYNRRLCYYIAQDKLIKKNRSDILKEYDKFIKKPADFMTIILHGGNHPDLRDSIDGLAEIYGNATTILFSLSKENRADLLFSFFRTALELQVDLEPILNKFIENNYEIELFNVIEILPPKSLKYLLEKSKKLIDREEFLEYAQSKIDEQEFYRARIENYKNYPSLEHHVMLACLYELHPEYFEYDDMDAIKQIYGENWVNVCEFQKQYEDIIKKIDEKTLKAEDLQDINLSVRLNDGIPLLFKLCESIDCNKLVLDKVETLQELLYLKDIKGRNIVEIAIESGNSELLTSLLGNEKPIIEPLVLTCACKHYLESETPSERNKDNIKALLKSVVDPNYKMSGGVFNEIRWEGVTMLDIFLYRNDLDLVEFALKKYKNIKIYSYNINSLIEYLDSIQNQVAKNNVDDKDEKFNKIIEILQIAIDKENAEITDEHVSNVLRIMSAQNKDQIHEDVKELCRKFLGKMRKEEGKEAGRGNRRLSNIVGSLPCMVGNGDDPPPSPPSPPSYRSLALHPTHEASAAKR